MQKNTKLILSGIAVFTIASLLLFAPLFSNTVFTYHIIEGFGVRDLQGVGFNQIPNLNVKATIIHPDGTTEEIETHNVITNVGMNWTQYRMLGTPTPDDVIKYIALSTNQTAPDDTWTDCTDEIGADGLQRATGTVTFDGSVTSGDFVAYVHNNFTYSGSSTTVYKSCLMTDSTDGAPDVPFAIANLSPSATLGSGDKLNLQWEIDGNSG